MPVDPVLAVGDVIEVVQKARHATYNEQIVNRSYHRVVSVPGSPVTTMGDARVSIYGRWLSSIMSILNSGYEHLEVESTLITQAFLGADGKPHWSGVNKGRNGTGPFGSVAGARLPLNVTVSVRYATTYLGRYWRGGVRLSPIPSSYADVTNYDKLAVASQTAVQAAVDAWRVDVTATGGSILRLVIASATYAWNVLGNAGGPIAACADVSSAPVTEFFRTLRTRNAPFVP